jgi:putative MFS transporter
MLSLCVGLREALRRSGRLSHDLFLTQGKNDWMFEQLEARRSLTANQWRIVAAAIIGDMLEFFDYFLIGFVLAFIVGPWQLSFGQSAIILLSSGIGAILGATIWGRLADRIGRRTVFIGTVLNFSLATGILALTPDHGWIFLTIFRFFVGFGVGGLYCVDLPLVQEFVPASRRGFVGGLVTAFIPIGVMIGSVLGAFLAPVIGWRGLFACGLIPAALTLLIRAWVPESPRWLVRMGRPEEARRSLAWALQVQPESLPLPKIDEAATQRRLGATYSAIRVASSSPGSAILGCRQPGMASFSGRRRCS